MKSQPHSKHDSHRRDSAADRAIVAAGTEAIDCITTVPPEAIQISARAGWVTLKGAVEEWSEKETVEQVARHATGVRGVTGLLTVNRFHALLAA